MKYYNLNEVSKRTHYKVGYLRELIAKKKIIHCKKTSSGYRWLVREDDVERLKKDDN